MNIKTKQRDLFYVHYVEDSSPKLKSFKTLKETKLFYNKNKKELEERGYWSDFIIKGMLVLVSKDYEV